MNKKLIKNVRIINEGRSYQGAVLINGEMIEAVYEGEVPSEIIAEAKEVVDGQGKWLLPGCIDDQVHFREPGLTHKADIYSESRAAVAGGVTSFMDMPNTKPQTTTLENLEWKFNRAAETSVANYSFFFGGTNDNMEDIRLDISFHSKIRSEEACYASSSEAVELATRLGTRLHILHLSTAKETTLLDNKLPLKDKKITGEVCVHHLWFHDGDYALFGNRIKWNPSIKTLADRTALREAVNNDKIDIIATDHAPHLLSEKEGSCLKAASGGPLVQHSLIVMLELAMEGRFTYEKVVDKMAHKPAELFHIDRRGYIRPGYYADLVLIDPNKTWTVSKENILTKCGWSPFEGYTFHHAVDTTWVNGEVVWKEGQIRNEVHGKELKYIY